MKRIGEFLPENKESRPECKCDVRKEPKASSIEYRVISSICSMNSGMGTQIKHQYHLCPYWVDIAFPTMKLAFEIDGPMHASSLEYDRARDERLKKLSWRTIRFELIEMPDEKQIAGIAEKIVSECDAVFRAMREQRAASRVQCPICTLEVGHEMDHEKKARMLYDHFLERHKDHPSVKRQLEKRKPESDVSA